MTAGDLPERPVAGLSVADPLRPSTSTALDSSIQSLASTVPVDEVVSDSEDVRAHEVCHISLSAPNIEFVMMSHSSCS